MHGLDTSWKGNWLKPKRKYQFNEFDEWTMDFILQLYYDRVIPVRGRKSRQIYLVETSNVTDQDNNFNLSDTVLLLDIGQTISRMKASCPYYIRNTRHLEHRRVLLTTRGRLTMDVMEFYQTSLYK